ncbi:MAG: F0F1 ATP synthase subunit delta [Candidatus Omnitrophota bacterium]
METGLLMGKVFVIVFCGQIAVISIIVFVLVKILHKQLMESAIQKVLTIYPSALDLQLSKVEIIAYSDLAPQDKAKITDSLLKKCGRNIPLEIRIDKSIKGGVIINMGKQIIDHSLISRLQEAGVIKYP